MPKDKRRKDQKTGWFARLTRKFLEEEWNRQRQENNIVLRSKARENVWDRTMASGELRPDRVLPLVDEFQDVKEQLILSANQSAFSRAVNDAHMKIKNAELEPRLPFLSTDDAAREHVEEILAETFAKVQGLWLRDAASNYEQLKLADDVDFLGMWYMTQVRDDQTQRLALSTESYQYAETWRHALDLPEDTCIRDIVRRGNRAA